MLDQSFNLLGVIDEYVSVIWRPSYSDVGDFEIYLSATDKAIGLLWENNYVVRSSDITVDSDGNTLYKNVMIIKNLHLVTDVENGDYLTVTGKELKFLLHQRIVWTQTRLTGKVESAIRQLVTENAISPTNPNRVIPNLVLGKEAGLTAMINKQITGEHLDQAIVDICNSYSYGWDIYIFNDQLVLRVYEGVNRSYYQHEYPYVVFSNAYENLNNTEYQLITENYFNTTLIGGEGEGLDRIYTAIGDELIGLNRYETFTDAKDVSQNKGTDDEISLDIYKQLLAERGCDKLATSSYTEGFSGEVLSNVTFKYNEDFFLGDLLTIINKYGISRNVRVMSAIESDDETGTKLIPQFVYMSDADKNVIVTIDENGIVSFSVYTYLNAYGVLEIEKRPLMTENGVIYYR